jgi:nucleoside-diphosphate-sugar epimerase
LVPEPEEHLLLTGATGLLGRQLLAKLRVQNPARRIAVLVRKPEQAERFAAEGLTPVPGDLTRFRLGIPAGQYEDLSRTLTGIIHAGADVRFDLSLTESRAVNLYGTRQMLDLARRCPSLRKMVQVSTVYVNGYREGVFDETPVPPGHRYVNPYQQSKHEAEWLALDAMRELPLAVMRLSLVIADSADGTVSQYNYFHHLLRYLPGSALPLIPGDPEVPADLIPSDWAAAALAYWYDHRFTPGAVRNVCAGPGRAIRLSDAIECICRTVEQHPGCRLPKPVKIPKLVSVNEYDRYLAKCRDTGVRALADAVGNHVRLLGIRQVHRNGGLRSDLGGSGIELGDALQYLERTVRYCLDTEWGRKTAGSRYTA